MTYPWANGALLTSADLNAAFALAYANEQLASISLAATGSTTARTLANRFADNVAAKDYGVVADGVTDDTAALQAAINAAQASGPNYTQTPGKFLQLPSGRMLISGVTITAPIAIAGHGTWGTLLILKSGLTVPAITISLATTAFSSVNGFAEVHLSNLQLTSPNRQDATGLGVAHGISLLKPANAQTVAVHLDNVLINAVAGDGIHSTGLAGFVEATNCEIAYPGGYGIYANSVYDWIWTGGNIYGANQDDILLSGTTNFRFDRVNVFAGLKTNFNIYNSDLVVTNSMLDTTGTDGLFVNNQNGARVDLIGCTLRWASNSVTLTYSDLQFSAVNTGDVHLTNCVFRMPATSPFSTNRALYNISFQGGNTGRAILSNTDFDLGPVTATGVTNAPASIITGEAISTLSGALPLLNFDDMAQASGLRRMVIQNNSQLFQVYSTSDAGVLVTLGLTVARNGVVSAPVVLKCGTFGANGSAASGKVTITGSRGGATATVLESLLQAMQTFGLIVDSTSA